MTGEHTQVDTDKKMQTYLCCHIHNGVLGNNIDAGPLSMGPSANGGGVISCCGQSKPGEIVCL
jgi:hypothetical protein